MYSPTPKIVATGRVGVCLLAWLVGLTLGLVSCAGRAGYGDDGYLAYAAYSDDSFSDDRFYDDRFYGGDLDCRCDVRFPTQRRGRLVVLHSDGLRDEQ